VFLSELIAARTQWKRAVLRSTFELVNMDDKKLSEVLRGIAGELQACSQCECFHKKCDELEREIHELKSKLADKSLSPLPRTENLNVVGTFGSECHPDERIFCNEERTDTKPIAETGSTASESSYVLVESEYDEIFEDLTSDCERTSQAVESVGDEAHSEVSSIQEQPHVRHCSACDCRYARVSCKLLRNVHAYMLFLSS
jgi:hypothetical protein